MTKFNYVLYWRTTLPLLATFISSQTFRILWHFFDKLS